MSRPERSRGAKRSPRSGSASGSVLLLVPAAVLILVMLASIAVDSAVVFLAQRELANAAGAAARDAASALSDPRFYGGGDIAIDPDQAGRVARASIAARDMRGVAITEPVEVTVAGRQVCVALTGRVDRILARSVPGVPSQVTVRARSTATAAGGLETSVPRRAIC